MGRQSCSCVKVVIWAALVTFVVGQWDFNGGGAQWELGGNPGDPAPGLGPGEESLQSRAATWDREKRDTTNWHPNDNGECPWFQWDNHPDCPPGSETSCYDPPFFPYDEIHRVLPNIGTVVGRSMTYAQDRYINIFKGVPYAKPPVYERKYKPPEDPGPEWDSGRSHWCADRYGDACPQEIWRIQDRFVESRNMSEDCLHLNIFSPNISREPNDPRNKDFPVMVYVHGTDYKLGDAKLYPGHILARKEVLVITFNYRLGALGFMSTLDSASPGNYGLHDTLKVLEFIQRYIRIFRGDPSRVTLVGHDSGAAMIGLLMVSPRSTLNSVPLFHQAVLMSGSDLCEWSMVDKVWNADARTYAQDLGQQVGCDPQYGLSMQQLVDCLRMKHFDEIVNGSAGVHKRYGSLAGPFAPVVDGDILPRSPKELRDAGNFTKIKVIAGVTKDEGAYLADNSTKHLIGVDLADGLDPETFRDILYDLVGRRVYISNVEETVGAMEYEYTYWAKPDNRTAVKQNLIDLWSDQVYGWCVDDMLKYHAALCDDHGRQDQCEPVYMYEFVHRSEYEPLPLWQGTPHGRDVNYLFGHPFFNDTLGNITGIIPEQWDWTWLDRNISEFVQDMWVNFTRYNVPTIDWTRNVSWYPFSQYNLSYLHISEYSRMDINYRQNHYAFWREYIPEVAARLPITTTPQPTPRPMVGYQFATWTLVGASLIAIFVIVALGITLWRRSKGETELGY